MAIKNQRPSLITVGRTKLQGHWQSDRETTEIDKERDKRDSESEEQIDRERQKDKETERNKTERNKTERQKERESER